MRKRRSFACLLLCLLLVLSIAGCAQTDNQSSGGEETTESRQEQSTGEGVTPTGNTTFTPGTYTGVGDGRNGPIVVQGDFTENVITDLRVISHKETYLVGNVPVQLYPELVVKNQSLSVDIVTGATVSSVGVLAAIRDCVEAAGGDPAQLNGPVDVQVADAADTVIDVVVVGGGSAGLTAAVYAAQAGKSVMLVEKLGILGGTSTYSVESFGASEAFVHRSLGVNTTATGDAMYENYVSGNPSGDPEIFDILAHNNGAAADWLRSIGAPMTVTASGFSVTASREAGKMGIVIVGALINEAEKTGVDLRVNSKATELVMEDGAITGIKVEGPGGAYTVGAKSVVLATGGFAANNEMVSQYWPALAGYSASATVGATGDGHLMAQAVGAELADMENIRVNFTYYTNGLSAYYTGALSNTGAIFVDNSGQRIINDQAGYGAGRAVVEQGGEGWMIFDRSMIDTIQDVRDYYDLGFYESAETIEELADKIGVDKANLTATIERYVGFVENGTDEDFGRAMLNLTFDEPPYYACKMTAHVQGTFGGIRTNTATQVLTPEGEVISGLYAAGECASEGTNGANPMAVNIVFGRIAGENAAENAA